MQIMMTAKKVFNAAFIYIVYTSFVEYTIIELKYSECHSMGNIHALVDIFEFDCSYNNCASMRYYFLFIYLLLHTILMFNVSGSMSKMLRREQ